eukprot:TRINITY_DN8938_c0_g1_i2.p1 TRINITY_DN8938_c0_g1~~TRINITY_DN8938_c0_g1_i2.p1  ORF type:complete len:952 (+),score=345.92 TRINITY_DN8938_c0_g1_i2:52-2907(+)
MDEQIASQITTIQQDANNIRNFCMIAHVDHGKTTLSDVLISSNGLISQALAGKVRYLDCREDEQEKLITMKASTIALRHVYNKVPYCLNLIDSPGHVDFSCEVSTAVRLSDGAFILVDAIDGVATQTRAVMQQAYREKVKCCLVINKIDLLVTTAGQDPETAYQTLASIIQNANVLMASFALNDAITGEQLVEKTAGVDGLDDDEEEGWFEPSKGNVIFASSIDGWGFTTRDFAKLYSAKLGWSEAALTKALWGEWYLDMKNKKINRTPKAGTPPMCVKFILQQIWKVYEASEVLDADERLAKLLKITDALNLKVKENVLKKKDPRSAVAAVMNAWLPLSKSVLDAVVTQLPSPVQAQGYRMARLIPDLALIPDAETKGKIEKPLLTCDKKGDVMVYVAKMLDVECLPGTALQASDVQVDTDAETKSAFVGVARIFCGTIEKGMTLYVMDPKHKPGSTDTIKPIIVEQLFLLMGRGLAPVNRVPAGGIFGIGGLGGAVLKSASLSTRKDVCGFTQMVFQSAAVIRMSVEPKIPSDLGALKIGLALLNKADPQVEVILSETGEHVIATAGEVHAERCIRDLTERYARVELNVSEPLVTFKETIVTEQKKSTVSITSNKQYSFTLKAYAVPEGIMKCVEENEDDLKGVCDLIDVDRLSETNLKALNELREQFVEAGGRWAKLWGKIWSFGPKQYGSCLLFNEIDEGPFAAACTMWTKAARHVDKAWTDKGAIPKEVNIRMIQDNVVAGFQMAADKGPLCDQPMTGVAFVLEEIEEEEIDPKDDVYGPLSGQVMSAVFTGCRNAFSAEGKRLVEPVYECTIQASNFCHGKVYEVLKKRRAEIVDNIPQEGTDAFTVISYLPITESFGLADELRIKTSGHATPGLVFSHWSVIDADPFFSRKTEDEIEDLDENDVAIISNVPRTLINKVRKRKGLHVEEQAVAKAEKMKYSTRGG